ncbi:DUF559 domain-containing protein [Mycetocola miduiensis]|uniref:DUF559 domain-containing protein n=1 Tax=Mycetocola miduiensis TaxID=995034 RepID=A0A1I5D142_9MICO|nr:DUF559 domain-containing protein [Mycetocola miduiensis]SFN92867.1 Protein of unknown function [Mycetocola miduiensis]
MTRRKVLPAELRGHPFTSALARELGVSKGRLSASDLAKPFGGIRLPADKLAAQTGSAGWSEAVESRRDLTRKLCRAYSLRMPPDAFYCGPTAALVHGMPLPLARSIDPRLHVGLPKGSRAVHIVGAIGHSYDLDPLQVTTRDDVRLTSVERTWCDLARVLPLDDLVAAGDWLLFWRSPRTTVARLNANVELFRGQRGVKKLRLALTLLNERAESPRESRLRVALVLAGLPAPEVNVELFDTVGRFLARADLVFRRYRLILEYEGLQHLTSPEQWRRDIERTHALEDEGWRIIRVTAADLRDPRNLIERIRRHIFASCPV